MHLAIIHYHLNRGGVTQVICNHLRALACAEFGQSLDCVTVLYGGRRQGWPEKVFDTPSPFELRLVAIPELEYDSEPAYDPEALTKAILGGLAVGGQASVDTLLHIHNHALGKNASLVGAIENLTGQGFRILLQIHDFAEDFRPDNYRHLAHSLGRKGLAQKLYPQSPAIHYAVLNGRDKQILQNAGVANNRLHLLSNPVAEFEGMLPHDKAKPIVSKALGTDPRQSLSIYPVRGIRRKNLGEMLLLSAMQGQLGTGQQGTLAVTLAPLNPVEARSFQSWQQLSEELGLNCKFDIGATGAIANLDYLTILAAADRLLTTSIAEGFGMVFLEAWLVGRMLVGRNLPEITTDFSNHGISYDAMYDRLRVPWSMVDQREFCASLTDAYGAACCAYGSTGATDAELKCHLDELTSDGTVDFGQLDARLQRNMIAKVAEGSIAKGGAASQLRDANPTIETAFRLDSDGSRDIIERNAKLVRENYSLEAAGAKLVDAYRTTFQSPTGGPTTPLPHAEKILDAFLDIRRLHPIRLT